MIQIKRVETKKELKDFIKYPDILYKNNKYRVPQLHSFEEGLLNRKKNPAFDFCETEYFLAYKDGKIVGRIAGIINHKFVEIWKNAYVRFGWIDFIDDFEVSSALFKAVEDWAKSKGMTAIHGPLGFTDMDLEGALVEGFEEVSTQTDIYNYPYYPVHYEKLGLVKDVDWIQFEVKVPDKVPDKVVRVAKMVKEKYNLRIVNAKKPKDFLPYTKSMFNTLNEAFQHLYGYVPLTDKQIDHFTKAYFGMVNPNYICLVIDEKDEVVAFGLALLSLSEAFQKAKGKLFPFGFIHILRGLRKNDKIDLLMQGVKPEYHKKGVPSIFFSEMMQNLIDNGVKTCIVSHILEDNKSSWQMFGDYAGRTNMRRRCYLKKF